MATLKSVILGQGHRVERPSGTQKADVERA
jgi:hypothetical protein